MFRLTCYMCKVNLDVTCIKYIWINTVGIMTASKSQKRNGLVSCKILSKYINKQLHTSSKFPKQMKNSTIGAQNSFKV